MDGTSPEQIELEKKRRVLERLKDKLADREEDMADLRAELEQFEARYSMEVARLYAEFDEIEAEIAEEELKLVPDDEEIKKRVEELRRRAEESAARAEAAHEAEEYVPTPEAKKAYHNLARVIHPDLALDEKEKERRHGLMAELNRAYSSGDQQKLDKMIEDLRHSPDTVKGDSIGDELVRVIRQIYQVNKRFRELDQERTAAEASELHDLRMKVNAEMSEGRDLLKQMAASTRAHILKASRRLENLRNVNAAQEQYVQEAYGMDIDEFR
jgi:chromosome segregation ATPase